MNDYRFSNEDLKKKFPLAKRQILRENFSWAAIFLLLCIVVAYVNSRSDPLIYRPVDYSLVEDPLLGLIYGAFAILALKTVYSFFYHRFISYKLKGDHLVISYGVVLKKKDIVFIDRIVDVYIKRNLIDVLFGLNELGIVVLARPDIRISGFPNQVASQFQQFLVRVIEADKAKALSSDENAVGHLRQFGIQAA